MDHGSGAEQKAHESLPRIGIVLMTDRATKDDHVPRYGMNRTYFEAIRAAGGLPVPISPGPTEELVVYMPGHGISNCEPILDGVCLAGGGDPDASFFGEQQHPQAKEPDLERDRTELHLIGLARERALPILGICRGIQIMNIALGGTLIQDIASQHGTTVKHDNWNGTPRDFMAHEIRIAAGSLLAHLIGAERISVNSLHHQALGRLGRGLRATAWAPDGIVEAVEADAGQSSERTPFLLGVQFHPEDLQAHEPMRKIFASFVADAARYRRGRGAGE